MTGIGGRRRVGSVVDGDRVELGDLGSPRQESVRGPEDTTVVGEQGSYLLVVVVLGIESGEHDARVEKAASSRIGPRRLHQLRGPSAMGRGVCKQ